MLVSFVMHKCYSRGGRTSAFGVGSVWMNIVRRATVADTETALCAHGCARGLCWSVEDVMGDDCLWRDLVAMRGACDRREDVVFDNALRAARGIVVEAMLCSDLERLEVEKKYCSMRWRRRKFDISARLYEMTLLPLLSRPS